MEWIKEAPDNERVFYQIYSKLFSIDVNANARGDVTFTWKAPQLPPKMSAGREPAPRADWSRSLSGSRLAAKVPASIGPE